MFKSLELVVVVVFLRMQYVTAAAIAPRKATTLALNCNFLNCLVWNNKCRYNCAVHIIPDCTNVICDNWQVSESDGGGRGCFNCKDVYSLS
ncbi:BQ2448_6371 [Microbotryum intermedium]|uniref:BQ2448_6371 protein n=1 Tax=Microbotryum intermedium TaxID=269621 RepID=A0A238FP21_9BASI|nr:BQ2448_6371 [Microbotryum intermedium]